MTLQERRERIATAALAGLLANPGGPIQHRPDTGWGLVNCAEEHSEEMVNLVRSAERQLPTALSLNRRLSSDPS